jgi:hypothetical protein
LQLDKVGTAPDFRRDLHGERHAEARRIGGRCLTAIEHVKRVTGATLAGAVTALLVP